MGRRQRARRDGGDSAFPIQYLLPVPSTNKDDSGEIAVAPSLPPHDPSDEFASLNLYRQAVPLVHPKSTAAIKTIGKMLHNPQIAQRMLQRNQINGCGDSATTTSDAANCQRRIAFSKTCEKMFIAFDPIAARTGKLPLHRLHLLLKYYELEVDAVGFRQWEQSLPADCREISLVMFIQACTQWFRDPFLIDHYETWQKAHCTAKELIDTLPLGKCQSAPHLLHPFDALARHHDDALAFSYSDHAHNPPRHDKSSTEKCASTSQAMIKATLQLRRENKHLERLQSLTTIDTTAPSLVPSSTHGRLHEEKLAHHLLERCSSKKMLVPSHNPHHNSSTSGGGQTVVVDPFDPYRRKQQRQKLAAKKLLRAQNSETAKAFSTSIAMISRHVHHEELRDLRDIAQEKQLAMVDERKQLRRLQQAHCHALAQEKSGQQLRDVVAMKALADQESELQRKFMKSREQLLRLQKPIFTLSSSTSTLFQQPPEVLAASATTKTTAQKKQLLQMEKEHLDHMRSVQLMDYAYDRKCAIQDAREPKADATLLQIQVENLPEQQENALAAQELWTQLLATCHETHDLTPFLPPPNSPPAALRFFKHTGPKLSGFLPPFTSSTTTPSMVSKVP